MPALRTLKVFPNPYKRYDADGNPVNVVPMEPEGDGVKSFDGRKFVGAFLSATILEKFPEGDARQNVQQNLFKFSDEAVVVKDTPYYRDAIRRGDLIVADPETARKIGKIFVDPAKVLETEKAGAIHHWEKIEKHEDTDEKAPDCLRNHACGPMKKPEEKPAKTEEKPAKTETAKGGK